MQALALDLVPSYNLQTLVVTMHACMHIIHTDLKIDWIWHLLINVLRILKPGISQFAWQTIQVIGPTLLYFST